MRGKMGMVFFILSMVTIQDLVVADIINVPAEQPTIQAAINAASNGDTVLVADGLYYENIRFKGKAITVASQFIIDGDSTHKSNTIINGSQHTRPDSGSVVYFISGEDTNSVLIGFTITGGTGTVNSSGNRNGGGILVNAGRSLGVDTSAAKISHNIIENNSILTSRNANGGGICITSSSNGFSVIEKNVIRNNTIEGNEGVTGVE